MPAGDSALERFAEAVGIVFYDGACGVEDVLRGAVVAFEANHAGGGKVARKAKKDGDVRAAPTIDGLVFIADDADVLLWAGEETKQIVLDAVGVLIFVDVDVSEALLPVVADLRRFLQEAGRAEQEIVEIEGVTLGEEFFVGFENVGDFAAVRPEGFAAHLRSGLAVILGVTDFAEDIARREGIVADVEA